MRFTPQELETVYMGGLSDDDLTQVETLAKNVFDAQQVKTDPSAHAITLRAPASSLNAFNATMRDLLDGRSQVLLDVRLIQVAHTSTRNTGAQLPQSMSAFNVYAEEQSILNANQSLVQQIISSGLASPNDPLAILAILIASGQVSSSLLSSGFALFGGGLTESALVPGTATLQPQPEHLRLARVGPDSASPAGRRRRNAEIGREVPHPNLFVLKPVAQRAEYSGIDGRGQLQQPVVAAFVAQFGAERSNGAV